MSIYSEGPSATDPVIFDDTPPLRRPRVLAGFNIAVTVWLLTAIGIGLATQNAAHGMPFDDYTDYSTYGGWIGLNATMSGPLLLTVELAIPVTIIMVISSSVSLTKVRSAPGTFHVLLAGTITLLLANVTLYILYSKGMLLFISNLN